MDTRCPHCLTELGFRYLSAPKRRNMIAAGNAVLSCCHCGGGLVLNIHPEEGGLPCGLTGESAVFAFALIAGVSAYLLAPFLPPAVTAVAVIVVGVLGLVGQQVHFYKATLASWPRYKAGSLRFVKQAGPHS